MSQRRSRRNGRGSRSVEIGKQYPRLALMSRGQRSLVKKFTKCYSVGAKPEFFPMR
jgi:hypothetical protein